MAAPANVVFVIASLAFSLALTMIFSVWFFFTMTNPSAVGRETRWLSWVIIALVFFTVYPCVFLAIDVVDSQTCIGAKRSILEIGGIDTGCNIPILEFWEVLAITNVFLSCAVMPYLIVLRYNHTRPRRTRILLSLAAGVGGFTFYSCVVLLMWALPRNNFNAHAIAQVSTTSPICTCQLKDSADCVCLSHYNATHLPQSSHHGSEMADGAYTNIEQEPGEFGYGAISLQRSYKIWQVMLKTWMVIGDVILFPMMSVGLVYRPLSLIVSFCRRQKVPLTKSEHITAARSVYLATKEIKRELATWAEASRGDPGFLERMQIKWKLRQLSRGVMELELRAHKIDSMFPQGRDPEVTWTIAVIATWANLLYGIVSALASALWLCNVALFLVPQPAIAFVMDYLVNFRDYTKINVADYLANLLDMIFLVYMILHLLVCTASGLIWLTSRITLLKGVAVRPRIMTITCFLDALWPLMISACSIAVFVTHNLRAAMQGSQILNQLAAAQGSLTLVKTGMGANSIIGIYLLSCMSISVIIVPMLELCSPLPVLP